jgi:putative membrane protein
VTIFLAFLHHLAAFALVAALTVELVLLNGELTLKSARRLQMIDAVYGASAGLLLLVGLLRVFYFEKGAAYYFHSAPFIHRR